jgi:tripeptide aminopeptidase
MINKERLIEEFLELVQIDSLSSKEGAVAKVLVKKLEKLGFEVSIDDAGIKFNGETGNVVAKLKGNRVGKKILFSAHMDTVSPGLGIKPIIDKVNGIIKSDGTTVLGADDKAGITAVLEAMRIIKDNNLEHGDIEIIFSIWEEGGLFGAKGLEFSKLNPDFVFVLDSGGAPGNIVIKAPAQDKIRVKIKGKAAHAGVCPEEGVSAVMVAASAISKMKLLRIDEETTANIGTISGGEASNIVMPELEILAEARSLNNSKLMNQTNHMVNTFKEAAKDFGAEIDIKAERMYDAFTLNEADDIVVLVKKSFSNIGIEARVVSTGGGSDTNIFNANGLKAVNLGIGMKNAHTLEENIAIADLITTAKMVLEIIKEA